MVHQQIEDHSLYFPIQPHLFGPCVLGGNVTPLRTGRELHCTNNKQYHLI